MKNKFDKLEERAAILLTLKKNREFLMSLDKELEDKIKSLSEKH